MTGLSMKIFIIFCFVLVLILVPVGWAQQISENDDFSYALKLYNEKFYDLAAQQFVRFVNNYPNSDKLPEAGYYSGKSLYNLGEYEIARVEFQGVAVDFPNQKRSADSWFMIGECYLKLDNKAEAAKAFETVKILHPNHTAAAQSILRAGKLFQQIRLYEKAEQLYILIQTRYVESAAYFPSILAHGNLYFELGNYSKAEEKLRKVIESSTDAMTVAEAHYLAGEMSRLQGFSGKASNHYQQIIKNHSRSKFYAPAALSLAQIHLQRQKYADARNILSSALKVSVSVELKRDLEERLGDANYLSGKYALALKNYENSALDETDSSFVIRKLKTALTWQKQKSLSKAVSVLKEIVLSPDYRDFQGYFETKDYYFGLLMELKDYIIGASELYQLKLHSEFSYHDKSLLASFLKYTGDWAAVIKELEPSIYTEVNFPEKDDFILEVAIAYEKIEKYDESARYYSKLLREFAPSEQAVHAKNLLSYLNNFKIVDQNVGINQLTILMGDIINQEKSGELQFKLAKIYYQNLKNYEAALNQFEKSISLPENQNRIADIHYYIGMCYKMLSGQRGLTDQQKNIYLGKAKTDLSAAMENLSSASEPDLISWEFVKLGVIVDKPSIQKQTGYYNMLLSKYPESIYREQWHAEIGRLSRQDETTYAEALAQYKILIEHYKSSPEYPQYLYNHAEIRELIAGGTEFDEYKIIASSYPSAASAARAMYKLGYLSEKKGQYSDARILFDKLIAEYYYTAIAGQGIERRADVYLYSGQYDLAISSYKEQICSLPPDDIVLSKEFINKSESALYYKMGQAYFNLNDWNHAREYVINYLLSDPDGSYSNNANFLLGEIYLKLNDPNSAILSFKKVSSADSDLYTESKIRIADTYFASEKYSDASRQYFELAKLAGSTPQEADAKAQGIIALIRGGKRPEAERLISQYSSQFKGQNENLAAFQFELGEYYRKNSNYGQAVKYFKKVLKSYKRTKYEDDAEYYLALTYISMNKQKEALDLLTGFSKKFPESNILGAVYNTLGGIYFRSEKYESALTSFKRALDRTSDPILKQQVMSNLIKAYTFVNFWDAALALSREYIETYPHADDVIDKKIMIGRAYVALNQVDRAVEILKETRLVADSEKEPEIQFYIGDAYFRSGQYESAIAEYVKIPLLSRKTKLQWEASALYYAGQSYEKLGRTNDAVRMYQEIVKRPGIDLVLKKDAQKRIKQISN